MRFTEERLEQAIIDFLKEEGYQHLRGESINRTAQEVILKDDLITYLSHRYQAEDITSTEIESIIRQLGSLPADDLYESNKSVMKFIPGELRIPDAEKLVAEVLCFLLV